MVRRGRPTLVFGCRCRRAARYSLVMNCRSIGPGMSRAGLRVSHIQPSVLHFTNNVRLLNQSVAPASVHATRSLPRMAKPPHICGSKCRCKVIPVNINSLRLSSQKKKITKTRPRREKARPKSADASFRLPHARRMYTHT